MAAFLARRLLQTIPLLVGVAAVVWGLVEVAPGDPIVAIAGEDGDPAYYAEMRERFGLDRPAPERFAAYLGNVARGDLGTSYRLQRPAAVVVLEALPATLLLVAPALLLATLLGTTLGTLAARRHGSRSDAALSTLSLTGQALPVFWTAQLLVLVFAYRLAWFPVQGMESLRGDAEGLARLTDVAHHMVLPVAALTLQYAAPVARVARASVVDVLHRDYLRTALAKGLPAGRVLRAHALRTALLPVVTVVAAQMGFLVTGSVLVETVFAWPGVGRLLLGAMLARDLPVVTAALLLLAVAVVLANLLADLLYAALDPRVRDA